MEEPQLDTDTTAVSATLSQPSSFGAIAPPNLDEEDDSESASLLPNDHPEERSGKAVGFIEAVLLPGVIAVSSFLNR